MSRRNAETAEVWHKQEIIKACRGLLENGGTVEQAIGLCLTAAEREFACRILVKPFELRVDGCPFTFQWPQADV
jgi:hypothetical protein